MPLKAPTRGLRILVRIDHVLTVIIKVLIFIVLCVYALVVKVPWVLAKTMREIILEIRIQHAIEDREHLSQKIHALLGKLENPPPELLFLDELAPLPKPHRKSKRKTRKPPLLKYTGDAQIKPAKPSRPRRPKPDLPATGGPPESA